MDNQEKINLYKVRDFSENFETLVKFLKQNYGPIIKGICYIIPLMLIISYFLIEVESFTGDPYLYINSSDMLLNSLKVVIGSALYLFLYLVISTYVICYMVQYSETKDVEVDPKVVWNKLKRAIFPLLGATILYGLAICFGFILCFIPGVIIFVYLIFYQFCYVSEENTGVSDCLSRSWNLVQNNWWITFAFTLVVGIVVTIVSYIFSIPVALSSLGKVLDIDFLNNAIYKYIATFISYTGTLLLIPISTIATGVLYFNRRSDYDDIELYSEIDSIGTPSNEDDNTDDLYYNK